jgi:hypothetical protein
MELIHCKDCAWCVPIEEYPDQVKFRKLLVETFGDILPSRGEKVGICRKLTFSKERPVWTREGGYCHHAERKE